MHELSQNIRRYIDTNVTKDISFRLAMLEKLYSAILQWENLLTEALRQDLNKSAFEAYETEIGLVLSEIRFTKKRLHRWMHPKRVSTPLTHLPARSKILYEPYGAVLIIAPWNYPVQLVLTPLIGAIAAGNGAVVKPSELAPHTAQVLSQLLNETFPKEYIHAVCGGPEATQALLAERWDYIFYTGSGHVGQIVMEAAAKHLTPLTLELGGKSPCIVDHTADIDRAAKKIVWGKLINAGQTCVAPDYILAEKSIRGKLIACMIKYIETFFGKNPLNNAEYPKIINEKHFHRLLHLLEGQHLATGGQFDEALCKIAPTILDDVPVDSAVMQEEIFGPLIPVLSFEALDKAIEFVQQRPKPLALYLFTKDHTVEALVENSLSFGGGCVNDTIMHITSPHLPFGGVGPSGMGTYHGKASFTLFSHQKSVYKRGSLFDISLPYPPYEGHLGLLKKILK